MAFDDFDDSFPPNRCDSDAKQEVGRSRHARYVHKKNGSPSLLPPSFLSVYSLSLLPALPTGVTIRFDFYDQSEEHLVRVLEVVPNSPAELAGLQPMTDFLLGTAETVFKGKQATRFFSLLLALVL